MGVDIEFFLITGNERQQLHFDRDYYLFLALGMDKYHCSTARVSAARDGEWFRTSLESFALALRHINDDEIECYVPTFDDLLERFPRATVEWRFSY